MTHGVCSKFHILYSNAKSKKWLRFDTQVAESIKVGNFFETQCRSLIYFNH